MLPAISNEPPLKEEIRKENYDQFIRKLLKNKEIVVREGDAKD